MQERPTTTHRKVAYIEDKPAVGGDLFPVKLYVKVLGGPTMLVSQHSTMADAETAARNLR